MVLRVNWHITFSSKMDKFSFHRFWSTLTTTCRFVAIMLVQMYTFPTYIFWMGIIFAPLKYLRSSLYWKIEATVYKLLIRFIGAWLWIVGYEIEELGDDLEPCYNQRCLFLANHQSTADVPMLMSAFAYKKDGVLSTTMWVISNIFRYTNFGLVSWIRGDFFISQGKDVREAQLHNLSSHLKSAFSTSGKKWIVLFPEGGFLSKRRESSLKYSRKNGHRLMYNVTLPRLGAANQILDTLSSQNLKKEGLEGDAIKWVVDVTIAYPKGDPVHITSSYTLEPEPPATTRLHYRRYPVEAVPYEDKEKFKEWLFERWSEKEDMLENFYKTGEFVPRPNFPQLLGGSGIIPEGPRRQRDPLKKNNYYNFTFLHALFIALTLFSWYILQSLWYFSQERILVQTSILLAVPEH